MKRFAVVLSIFALTISLGCDSSDDGGGGGGGAGAEFDASLYYTKTDSDARYYTQTQADTLLAAKQDVLSSRVLNQNVSGCNLDDTNVGWANHDEADGWTIPAGASSVMFLVEVSHDTPGDTWGDVQIGFKSSEASTEAIFSAPLSSFDAQYGTTVVGFIRLNFVISGDTKIYPYIKECTRTWASPTTMWMMVTPIMWLR